jgi:hypothetical protein
MGALPFGVPPRRVGQVSIRRPWVQFASTLTSNTWRVEDTLVIAALSMVASPNRRARYAGRRSDTIVERR